MPENKDATLFELFTEISIIEQLSRAVLENCLPDDLIAPHFTVLNHLMRLGDGRAPIDMARAFQVPKTTLTHTLKGLATHELIDMRPNPEDGRSKLVYLTQKGRDLRARVVAELAPDLQRIASGCDVDALADVIPQLRQLRQVLDADRNNRPSGGMRTIGQ